MGNSHAIWDHTVLPATRQRCESHLYPKPKQVLDLAIPKGCKAELTYVTWKWTSWDLNPWPVNCMSSTLLQCRIASMQHKWLDLRSRGHMSDSTIPFWHSDLGHVTHKHATVTKQYNLIPSKWQWCCVGVAWYWLSITCVGVVGPICSLCGTWPIYL